MPTTRHQHNFEDLSPTDFERLLYWLVKRSGDFVQVQWYGGSRDKGRDVVAYKRLASSELERWYIQCKRYQSINFSTLRDELTRLSEHIKWQPDFAPNVIVFATACPVPPETKDRAAALARELSLPEPYYWGRLELDEQLKAQPDTEKEFFGEHNALDTTAIQKLLASLDTDPRPLSAISRSQKELVGILKLRAEEVEEWFQRGMTRRGKETFTDSLRQFKSLHNAHVAALQKGQLVHAHEILGKIHRLLKAYDYEGPYAMARDFSYTYPGHHEKAPEIARLYESLKSESLDPTAKGEVLLLLTGFGANDFSELELRNLRLSDAELSECDFSKSDLTGAVFRRVNFRHVNLSKTCLKRALLSGVDLHAHLHDTDLRGATFHDMDLDHAWLGHSQIDGLKLINVTSLPLWLMMGLNDDSQFVVDLLVSAIQSGYRDVSYANLADANFDTLRIADVKFEKANLSRASMRSTELSGNNFMHADLSGVDFRESDISDCRFNGATMEFVDMSGVHVNATSLFAANLEGSNLKEALFTDVDFGSATLTEANLTDAILTNVNLSGSWLRDADITNVDLSEVDLREIKLDGAKLGGAVGLPKWILAGVDADGSFSKDLLAAAIKAGFRELADANLAHMLELAEMDLSGVNLERANLSHASFFQTNLSNANLRGALLEYTDFAYANLSNADLSGANLRSAYLSGVILTGANLAGADFGLGISAARDIPETVSLDDSGMFVAFKN